MNVLVETSSFALFGNHLYVSIYLDGQLAADYRAKNVLDAKSFVERSLQKLTVTEVEWRGDVIVPFVYHREGD